MAIFAVGAAALGIAGLTMYVNPGKAEAEELAHSMFGKDLKQCTPVERTAIDMAAGIPKLEGLRDNFQSLFPRPKPSQPKKKAAKSRSRNSDDEDGEEQAQGSNAPKKEYALYDDEDVSRIYPVHEDTADPDQRYLANFSDLKNLVPFDIETESLEDAGTYDIEEFLKENSRLPQTLTLPRQLGGAATSANLLINKLTKGSRAGLSEGYVLPGHAPGDTVHPPTEGELEGPPEEATRSLQAAVDYQLGAGEYQRGLPLAVRRALAARVLEEASSDESEEDYDSSDASDDESEDEDDEEESAAAAASAQDSEVDEDEEESD
jgi:hypothetical protein